MGGSERTSVAGARILFCGGRGCVAGFARTIVNHPFLMLISSGMAFLLVAVLAVVLRPDKLPEFQNAQKGFEPRGTSLAGSVLAPTRGLELQQCSGELSGYDDGRRTYERWASWADMDVRRENGYCTDPTTAVNTRRRASQEDAEARAAEDDVEAARASWRRELQTNANGQWGQPYVDGAPVCWGWEQQDEDSWRLEMAFESAGGTGNLLSVEAIKGTCALDLQLRSRAGFDGACRYLATWAQNSAGQWYSSNNLGCCASRSLGTYIAVLSGKTSCADLVQADVDAAVSTLVTCAPRYHDPVTHDLALTRTANSTDACEQYSWAYDAFHSLLDKKYLNPEFASDPRYSTPQYVKVLAPVRRRSKGRAFLQALHFEFLSPQVGKSFGGAELTAYTIGGKFGLFTQLLLTRDMPLIGIGTSIIVLMVWLYSGSIFITLLGMLQVFLAMAGAYFVYQLVVQMAFFPFLNMTGLFICIGIGADDIFVFLEALDLAVRTKGRDAPLEDVVAMALYDAGAATLVTSLTTAGAFLATAVSPITAIKCFGVFCSSVVLCDWLLMISYLPALCVIHRKYVHNCCECCEACPNQPAAATAKHLARPSVASRFVSFFSPLISHKFMRYGWLLLTIGLSAALSSQAPKLSYPTTDQIQLFPEDNPLERFCCTGPMAAKQFHDGEAGNNRLFLEFHWGFAPVDNGNAWDPDSHTTPPKVAIDPTSQASQAFLKTLCESARSAPWYDTARLSATHNCSLEFLMMQMEYPCYYGLSPSGSCCNVPMSSFPYAPSLFDTCLREAANVSNGNGLPFGRLLFERSTGDIRTVTMMFPTRHHYSQTFAAADAYWKEIDAWAGPALALAPTDMQGGFASLGMGSFFYALQLGTGESALQSTVVAAIIAGIVILVLTANVLVALYCTIAIGLVIGLVTGIVVLYGWSLGIIESVIFSTAIGMSCDFVAHLGFAYRQANQRGEETTREGLVAVAISRIAAPITAAALSTALCGLLMQFSSTVFNRNFGFFILLLMSLSWVYAMFCLLPALTIAGPLGNFLDLAALFAKRGSGTATTSKGADAISAAEA